MKFIYELGDVLQNEVGDRAIILNYGTTGKGNKDLYYAVFVTSNSGDIPPCVHCYTYELIKELYPAYIGRDFEYVCRTEDAAAEHFKFFKK